MKRESVAAIVAETLAPDRFSIAPGGSLRLADAAEESVRWEFFHGHLLDPALTRNEEPFTIWRLFCTHVDPEEREPVIAVYWSREHARLHVVRSIRVYGHEAYVDELGVIQSRPTQKWLRECVGTLELKRVEDEEVLRQHLEHAVFRAVVGSRLPITSPESPLPGFSLGLLGYVPSLTLPARIAAKELEFALRRQDSDIDLLVETTCRRGDRLRQVLVALFNHVALSPYTNFIPRLVCFLEQLAQHPGGPGPAVVVAILSYYLRHLVRHLTAYDLVKFHNLGANYPDALALDAFLRAYLRLIERHAELVMDAKNSAARMRRRALRQGWLARKLCEGLAVPEHPTSPGENLRVLPPPFAPVSDEELTQPGARTKRLFADEPAEALLTDFAWDVLKHAAVELAEPNELRELGMAVYLDRPLGVFKQPGEVDRTPILSYEAYSANIARQRLEMLRAAGLLETEIVVGTLRAPFFAHGTRSVPTTTRGRPGVVSLEDAMQASDDFIFLRTTRSSLDHLLWQYRFEDALSADDLAWLERGRVLLIRTATSFHGSAVERTAFEAPASSTPLLTAFDEHYQPRLQFALGQHGDDPVRYVEWDGEEHLEGGLRLMGFRGECIAPRL
jgi:hypothetical protein